ncbi:MAG TPA: hypothetical protein VFY35_13335 [Burkholderiaceae bacterium]|nr:hypothetical protein [Burkholderiaceae bacterium]
MGRLSCQLLGRVAAALCSLALCAWARAAAPAGPLVLTGYAGADGAISVQHQGDTVDPYFTLQALLLAREFGLDIGPYAQPWANWLVLRQKPDATFDRFCRAGPVWAPCKTADADDTLLALWLRLLDTMPTELAANPRWMASHRASGVALAALRDPVRGIYMVSPVYQHGLFMDNLEVLSYQPPCKPPCAPTAAHSRLAQDIHRAFWDAPAQQFLVSTQPEQKAMPDAFYPAQVTQLYPLLFDFKLHHLDPRAHYRRWMQRHRGNWLAQSRTDFAWGLVALIALKFQDTTSAGCWLRETAAARGSSHWIVTDEVARQVLLHHRVAAAAPGVACQ